MISNSKECDLCKYKNWDCKNCFIDIKEGDNINVTFFLIMTRQCNFRCNYCAIDFSDDNLSYKVIDDFVEFIAKNRKNINEIRLEFFGWEPLMEFERIKYIVEKTKPYNIAKYLIVTNGYHLDAEKITFFNENKFEVVFSVAIHSKSIIENKDLFRWIDKSNFLINFIIEPGKELLMYDIFKSIILLWFTKVSFIPIRYTIKWSEENLKNLDLLLKKIKILNDWLVKRWIDLNLFTWKNNDDMEKWVWKSDFEILLDVDGNAYADYEAELYILRDLVEKDIFDINSILLWKIGASDIEQLLKKRNTIKPSYHIGKIADHLNMDESDSNLGKVMSKYNINA